MLSDIAWPKTITLSGAYCRYKMSFCQTLMTKTVVLYLEILHGKKVNKILDTWEVSVSNYQVPSKKNISTWKVTIEVSNNNRSFKNYNMLTKHKQLLNYNFSRGDLQSCKTLLISL
jgi:hypothetical protein